jgi:hypothetical protein
MKGCYRALYSRQVAREVLHLGIRLDIALSIKDLTREAEAETG